MREEASRLKQQLPLLDYLQRHQWAARPVGSQREFVGLCPLHLESRPSFYVNIHKNLFYCHGCGRGGDLIRFAQLYFRLSFRETVALLKQELAPASESEVLNQTVAFYQSQLYRHPEATQYLSRRGVHDHGLIQQLETGYAPGGTLRRHLNALGYSSDLLCRVGLIDRQGRDTFFRRVVFPCRDRQRVVNLYGRQLPGSAGCAAAFPHRFLSRPKGGLFAWDLVRDFSDVLLVEGLFDVAVLWQAGFRNTTCAFGTHVTPLQMAQLGDRQDRHVFVCFDADINGAGQRAAGALAQQLQQAGLISHVVYLPAGHDPNSFFVAAATSADFRCCLQQARLRQP